MEDSFLLAIEQTRVAYESRGRSLGAREQAEEAKEAEMIKQADKSSGPGNGTGRDQG